MQTTERPAFKPAPERTSTLAVPLTTTENYATRVAAHWASGDDTVRSFWQSPVVMAEINRRITGDPDVTPLAYFRRKYCPEPRALGLSLGSGDGQLEIAAVEAGICERIIGIDIAPERVRRATERVPAHLRESWCDAFNVLLGQGGLLYVDDFIGPSRFQWTDSQIYVINRLLDTLPEPLRRDLVLVDGSPRAPVARPNVDKFIAADPSEAIRSCDIGFVLESELEPVELRDCGGALYHQFFNRIMGNFDDDPALVRMLMEVDFLLTDIGALDPNYLWGVYRPAR